MLLVMCVVHGESSGTTGRNGVFRTKANAKEALKMANYNKNDLIKELAAASGVKRKQVRFLLDALCTAAYREARTGGVSIPGLCRIDVITKKARKMRNPQTGQSILIAEHDSARIRIIKKAKDAIAPSKRNLVIPLLEDGETPAPPQEEKPAVVPPEIIYDDFSVAVSFCCKDCGGEIEAPAAAVGLTSECPVCGSSVVIPKESEPGTIHGPKVEAPKLDEIVEKAALEAISKAAEAPQKNKTIRIDLSTLDVSAPEAPKAKPRIVSFFCKNCHQELEAPSEMMGMQSDCPDCGASFEVPFFSEPGTLHGSDLEKGEVKKPGNLSGRTIRIEMPDF